jgi:mRNA-degrading endonuclease RelE of RelBE toxin-antitoxin system
VGRYRVLYSVAEKKLIIIVLTIGHRKDVYR